MKKPEGATADAAGEAREHGVDRVADRAVAVHGAVLPKQQSRDAERGCDQVADAVRETACKAEKPRRFGEVT